MSEFIIKRICLAIPVSLGVIILVSLMTHLIPGDPIDVLLGEFATIEEKNLMQETLGLHLPWWRQCARYIGGVLSGDLQNSLIYQEPVLELIGERVAPTVELAVVSVMIAMLLSLPLGILAALKKGHAFDMISMACALVAVAMPNFWLGPMLILFFSLKLGLLPVSENIGFTSFILPSITIGTSLAAILARMTRNSMLEVLKEDYIRTARSKGISEKWVIMKHALRNASLPITSVLGLQFGALLTGSVITEKVFDWPGLGTLMLESLGNRDYPLIQGCVLVFSISYLCINLLTDILYAVIDPRIKVTGTYHEV
ncbi:MAG: ABC transporter permease [Oligoflexales bacterium]|nr:ABC transporter permease [Oligoflexales bacterium]